MDKPLLQRLLTPAFLTEQIARRQPINGARLQSVTPRNIDAPGYLSDLVGVTMVWDNAVGNPSRAVLKVSHHGFGQQELPFYERIARSLHCPVVADFFAGGVDEPTQRTWLLLEDLSESHQRPSEAPLPPVFARSAAIVEALARFHAAGWHQEIDRSLSPTLWERVQSSEWLEPGCKRLFDQAGDPLDERTRGIYSQFLLGFPQLLQQVAKLKEQRTLIHGDAHVWNWMLPRDDVASVPRLLDWDGWQLGVGVWDLAYMMALQWDREVRHRFEMPLLDRYHSALIAAGVSGYSRETLRQDYRLAVLLHLRTPIARLVRNMSAYVWWPQLTRVVHAVQDLECLDLLKLSHQ